MNADPPACQSDDHGHDDQDQQQRHCREKEDDPDAPQSALVMSRIEPIPGESPSYEKTDSDTGKNEEQRNKHWNDGHICIRGLIGGVTKTLSTPFVVVDPLVAVADGSGSARAYTPCASSLA
ncbi:MAG: hypothetical protein J0J05_06725 [Microbacterium sp.]|uniref:hypothetical protein n=1 Tax=Microbacterium sp. TaxID=51671 RepID=UPI001AD47BCA|nr:hypothetical protein [Microbacterium sp.]MBN9153658.1 hypothetical protein [Microbacterium sp.]